MEVLGEDTSRYGIVAGELVSDRRFRVTEMVEKPKTNPPSRYAIIGRYILPPDIFPLLEKTQQGAGGEIQLTDAMAALIGKQSFHALTFNGERHDCGDPKGFVLANLALAWPRRSRPRASRLARGAGMTCWAVLAGDGAVRRLDPKEAASYRGPGFLWLHVDSLEEADLATLRGQDDIPDVAANALVATETRPRCDKMDEGALVNLRGLAETETDDSDRLVSIRMWVRHGRVNSVSRRRLAATRDVIALMEAGRIFDPGDLVTAFAKAISKQLDPQVADLGDTLDDCESSLVPRNVYKLRTRIARVRSEAIAFRRFVAPDRDALTTLAQLRLRMAGRGGSPPYPRGRGSLREDDRGA